MLSPSYIFTQFLKKVEDEDYLEIISLATREVNYVEPLLTRVKGAVERRKRGGGEYVALLKQFIFFMRYGIKPGGVPERIFRLYRPICENLVKKKQFKPSILDLFANNNESQ